jgi:hypothetical protein
MNYKLVLFFILIGQTVFGSGWSSFGNGLNQYAQTLFVDSSDSKIYVSGAFTQADSVRAIGIAVWNGSYWDSLGHGMAYIQDNLAITKFQNHIYSDGRFQQGSPNNFGGVFINNNWDSLDLGVNGPIHQFREINGELWISGIITEVDGNTCNMLAKWNGANWNCIYVPYWNMIDDFLYYNNLLVFGGNFFDSSNNGVDLAYYDGINFGIFNHPIYGGFSVIHSLIIFQGDLYVAGYFTQADGNEGNFIMRWDGNQWYDVGGGTDNEIWCMRIFNNELYVGGFFDYAGGIHTGNLAKWNGSQWSIATTSIISHGILDIQFYSNEIYISGGFTHIDSLQVNYIAKYSGPLSIDENILNKNISISPNPTNNIINIHGLKNPVDKIFINDVVGKTVLINSKLGIDMTVEISSLKRGLYFLNIQTKEGCIIKKFIKE